MSPLLGVDEGSHLESLKGYLVKNIRQNLSQIAMNFQRIHLKIWPKMVCLGLRCSYCFWVRAARERAVEKESILAR